MVFQNTEASLKSHYAPPRFPPVPLPSTETAGHKEEVAKISKQRAWFTDESRPCGPAALSELWREPLSGGNGLIINAMKAAVCLLWKIKQYYPHFTGQIKFLWAYLPTWSRCCCLWAGVSKEAYVNNSTEWLSGAAGCLSGWCSHPICYHIFCMAGQLIWSSRVLCALFVKERALSGLDLPTAQILELLTNLLLAKHLLCAWRCV